MEKNYTFYRNVYPSADNCSQVVCYFYVPSNTAPKAVLQISHGMCEYIRRYEHFADFLCQRGYVVCGNDHIGHGETAENEQELGFTAKGGGAEYMVDDVHRLTEKLREDFEGLPIALFGHSMGSFVVRRYLEKYPDAVEAAILSGTGGPDSPTGFGKALTRLLMLFHGEHYRSEFVRKIAFTGYNKHFADEKCENSWISRDRELVDRYGKDPYCHFTFTLRGYYDLFYLLGRVSEKAWAGNLRKDIPILMISGDEDPVGAYGVGVKKIYNRLIDAKMTNVTLKLYQGARHELINETNRAEVFEDIADWLNQKMF